MKTNPKGDLNTYLKPILEHRFFLWLTGIALLATLVHFIQHGIWEPWQYPNIDFEYYYHWQAQQTYTPVWGLLMTPYSFFSYPIAKQIWLGTNIIILFWFTYQIMHWLKENSSFPQKRLLYWLIPIVVILNYIPILLTLRNGQANLAVLLFLTLSIYCFAKGNRYLTGFFLALGILTKLTPVFLILYWLLKKEYRVIVSTLISIIILWGITIPLLGMEVQRDYIHWATTFPVHFLTQANDLNNISLFAWLNDLLHNARWALIVFMGIILAFLVAWYQRMKVPNNILLEYGWSVALIPILTHYTEDHHLVMLSLFYGGIWLYSKMRTPLWIWVLLGISWVMISGAFYFKDLFLLPYSGFLLRYINLYGTLLAWGSGWFLLSGESKTEKTSHD